MYETLFLIWKILGWAIRLIMLVVVPQRRPPAQARAWLFFIIAFPILGLIAYLTFGRAYLPERLERLRKRIRQHLDRASHQWTDHRYVAKAPLPEALQVIPTLAQNLCSLPTLRGNAAEILDTYPESEDALIQDIDSAQHHVHLLYYIYANDDSGRRVTDALIRAAQRGVTCRVLLDCIGAADGIKAFRPEMEAAGIELEEMLKVGFWKKNTARLDLRNHRKIAVIDGTIGYIGSANITTPEIRQQHRCEEIVLRLRGPILAQLQVIFLGDLYLTREKQRPAELSDPSLFPPVEACGDTYAQTLPSGPVYPFSNVRKILTHLIHHAREKVVITTPYFVPDTPLINALQTASLRGVAVTLIVPERSDNLLVTYAQESYFTALMEAGIRVYTFSPGLLHSKMITVDDEVALVGSTNIDIRSLDLNWEISLLLYDPSLVQRLRQTEAHYINGSIEITPETWQHRPRTRRFLQNMARLLDSFL